jgi:hypothetical protein
MKQKEKTELRGMKKEAIDKKAAELRSEIAVSVRERMTKPQKNVRAVRAMKKRLSVMLSIANEMRNA